MESEAIDPANEWAIKAVIGKFPSRVRDFLLVTRVDDNVLRAIHPLDLLGLDRAAEEIRRTAEKAPVLARRLALCRLLVPCLRYKSSGRHLVLRSRRGLRGRRQVTRIRIGKALGAFAATSR